MYGVAHDLLILNRSLLRWFPSSIQLSLEGMVGDSVQYITFARKPS